MSSVDIGMIFQTAARGITATDTRRILRIALLPGELVRVPRFHRHLHVLSGTAWISDNARDITAERGACVGLSRSRHPALVSGARGQPLLLEIW